MIRRQKEKWAEFRQSQAADLEMKAAQAAYERRNKEYWAAITQSQAAGHGEGGLGPAKGDG
jgi:hypothetical protein